MEPIFNKDKDIITLNYKENYKFVEVNNLTLTTPIKLNSAYSDNLNRILQFLKNPQGEVGKQPPFSSMSDLKILDYAEVYGIKMGYEDIDKTINFTKNFTLEPPMTFYSKGLMSAVDYIFYCGDMTVIRTLNIPDINKIAFDIGYLPNEIFPSDHICLCADFALNNEN